MTFCLFPRKPRIASGNTPRRYRRQRGQPDDAARLRGDVGCAAHRRVEVRHRSFESGEEIVRYSGQFDRARVAVEQLDAERLLQAPDLHRQGGLGDVQYRRSPGEALDASQRKERAHLPKADVHKIDLLLTSDKFNCFIMPFAA